MRLMKKLRKIGWDFYYFEEDRKTGKTVFLIEKRIRTKTDDWHIDVLCNYDPTREDNIPEWEYTKFGFKSKAELIKMPYESIQKVRRLMGIAERELRNMVFWDEEELKRQKEYYAEPLFDEPEESNRREDRKPAPEKS